MILMNRQLIRVEPLVKMNLSDNDEDDSLDSWAQMSEDDLDRPYYARVPFYYSDSDDSSCILKCICRLLYVM